MPRPNQRQLNEFLVDLVEFVQKHFQVPVTRTKILEENGCASVMMRHEPSGSELEISTLGGKVAFRVGDTRWTLAAESPVDLYGAMIRDLLDVFAGRRAGHWGGEVRTG